MNNLRRALVMAFRYKWSIIASTIGAILVAILWGANIGGVLPLVEIVFNGKSLHDMVDQRIADATTEMRAHETEIAVLEQRRATAADDTSGIDKQIAILRDRISAQQGKVDRTQWFAPWIYRYTPDNAFQTLLFVFAVLFGATLLRCFFLSVNMYLVARVGQRTILDIQQHLFRNTLQMELHELNVRGTGDLISRIRGETGTIGTAITTLFGKTLREPLKMVACVAGAAFVNWRLLLFSLIVVPVAAAVMLGLARVTKRAHRRAVEESAVLLDRLFQAVSYLRLVRAYNMQEHEHERFRTVATDVYRKSMKISLFGALARSNSEVLGVIVIAMSAIAGAWLVLNRETHMLGLRLCSTPMTPSEIMLFFAFLIGVADPLRKMGDVYNQIQAGAVAADRVFPLYDRAPCIADPAQPLPLAADDISLEYRNVGFRYEQAGAPANSADARAFELHDFSLKVPAGSSLAIVGANGCGKSTLVNLLLRFFDPHSGEIRIGGRDIRRFRLHDLRNAVGYVTQQTMLFSDTVASNIRYGSPNATDEQVVAAARRAHAHEFIRQLPDGYDSAIGEHGGKLSGGQRQRLALARAILKDAPILVLDEATSQIDPESEVLIHRSLADFIRGRTTIMITHRLSTLELADRILVMGDGAVVDCGTHNELLERCAAYQRLRASQLQEAA